ncbi:PLP-dependent aminotransferase family protein [Holdemania massiliensis]|uniref:aminotransferase-like domain-containing protein n=1 Tax=Holdemania massiliensis TaxID=1468449 RepID=UPI0036F32A25
MPINSFENYPMTWKIEKSKLRKPYYQSIASYLEEDILNGTLAENTKLPPQRELADFLDLNLSTITRAYKLCELKGLLYAVTGKGTFVSPGIASQDTFIDKNTSFIEMGMIKPFYEFNHNILTVARNILNCSDCNWILEYSNPFGTKRQISAAQKWLHHFGINTSKENILLSAGAQNALSVILISLFKAGDKIAVDSFTYTNFKGLANFLQIQLISIDYDEYGMSAHALLQTCKNTEIKGLYIMPTCSNPTSIFMPPTRRQEISEIARKFHLIIIEDDIYSFLSPSGVEPFFNILPEQTIHICSVSKSLSAGLRIAFVTFPIRYRKSLLAGMLNINLKAVSLNGEIVAELIESGSAFDIVHKKVLLAEKRKRIFESIFGEFVYDDMVRFFYWIPIPKHMTSEQVELLALQKGVHILGSHRFAMQSEYKSSFIRISITSPNTENDLKKGLQIIRGIFADNTIEFFV